MAAGPTIRADESEKLQALQTKLSESEEVVGKLKTELESVKEKLSQLSMSTEEPSGSADALEAVRAEHKAELERLTAAHTEELRALEVRLDEAETQRKDLEESSQKVLEEVRQSSSAQADSEAATVLENLKATHKSELEAIEKDLAQHKSSAASFEEKITALNKELEVLQTTLMAEKDRNLEYTDHLKERDQITEVLNKEIAKLNELKEEEVKSAEKAAQQSISEFEQQVAHLKETLAAAESATEEHSKQSSLVAEKDQEIEKLKQAIEDARKEAEGVSETAASQLNFETEQLGSAHEAAISSLKAEHEAAVSSLSSKHAEELDKATTAVESSGAEQIKELRDALEASKATAEKSQEEAIAELKTAHEAELESLQQRLQASEAALGESHQGSASAQDVAVKEIEALQSKCKSLESELASGTEKINALEELQTKHEALQTKYDELLASRDGLESAHAVGQSELQKQFEETQKSLQNELIDLQNSSKADAELHSKQISDLQAGFEETKAKLQTEFEAAQKSKAVEFDAEHGKEIEQLLATHESKLSGLREELERLNNSKIEELQKTHDAALANAQKQLTQASAAAEDTSALDTLKASIAELEGKLADSEKAHIAVQESATSTSRDIEDRYAAESAALRAELTASNEKYQAHVTESDSQKSHLESIMKQLSESRDELLKAKADHATISDSLVDCQSQNKTLTEKQEASKRDLNDQIDKNMGLLEQLGQFDSDISASRRRVRELETELAGLKTDSGDKSSTSGLGASRWATADEGSQNTEDGGLTTTEGEDLGPSIEGTVGDPRLKKSSNSSDLPTFHPST